MPNVGADVSGFAEVLEHERYFEVEKVVQDDLNRSAYYSSNAERSAGQARFSNYGEFLASLEMTAEIGPFAPGVSGANHAVDQQDESVQSHNQTVYER